MLRLNNLSTLNDPTFDAGDVKGWIDNYWSNKRKNCSYQSSAFDSVKSDRPVDNSKSSL